MLAAGIVQDTLAGKAGEGEGGEEETTGIYFYRYFYRYFYHYIYHSGWKLFRFLALEFLSQNTNTRMRIRNVRTYTYKALDMNRPVARLAKGDLLGMCHLLSIQQV